VAGTIIRDAGLVTASDGQRYKEYAPLGATDLATVFATFNTVTSPQTGVVGTSAYAMQVVSLNTVTRIEVQPAMASVPLGGTTNLKAVATFAGAAGCTTPAPRDVSYLAAWNVPVGASFISVAPGGVVSTIATGVATARAEYSGQGGTAQVTVGNKCYSAVSLLVHGTERDGDALPNGVFASVAVQGFIGNTPETLDPATVSTDPASVWNLPMGSSVVASPLPSLFASTETVGRANTSST
jgi:hypothetical protein